MRLITTHQLKFAITLAILTILFRFGLSSFLDRNEFSRIWPLAVLYGLVLMITGFYWGKKDYERLPFQDIGFRFHLITYLVCNAIGELWFLMGFQSRYEEVRVIHLTGLFWGIGMLIHFIFFWFSRKNTIKGIDKSDLFE